MKSAGKPSSQVAPRRLVTGTVWAAAAGLAVFHGWLLVLRLADGQLLEPSVALRWLVSGGLLTALVALRRAGLSLFGSRRALIVWLLVLLVHAGAAPVAELGDHWADWLFEAPAAAATVLLLAAVAGWLLDAVFALRRVSRHSRFARPSGGLPAGGFIIGLAARPPPLS